MNWNSEGSENLLPNLFRQLLLLLLSLLDDTLVIGLSRLGCKLAWLEWLSPIVIAATVIYTGVQFWRHAVPRLLQLWHEFRQKPEVLDQ